VQIPIGESDTFEGVIDLVGMHALYWDQASEGIQYEAREIPPEHLKRSK
jgi:elongation factor G